MLSRVAMLPPLIVPKSAVKLPGLPLAEIAERFAGSDVKAPLGAERKRLPDDPPSTGALTSSEEPARLRLPSFDDSETTPPPVFSEPCWSCREIPATLIVEESVRSEPLPPEPVATIETLPLGRVIGVEILTEPPVMEREAPRPGATRPVPDWEAVNDP